MKNIEQVVCHEPYQVFSYTGIDDLIDKLKNVWQIDERTAQNEHFRYLEEYFKNIKVQTIVLEMEYVDRDYLEDFSRYYSKCFHPYPKWCVRLHFFAFHFTKEDFEKIILQYNRNDNTCSLQDHYLGFIVLRPLPKTLFARICLKTYPEQDASNGQRNFPVVREYKAHLLGLELSIKTLAFLEQDNAVSACATSALWTALQGTDQGLLHRTSSPYEITLNAKKFVSDYSKTSIPDKGLLPSQMAHAIKEEGLEPLLVGFVNTSYLKALVRAYLSVRVPVILGFTLRYEEEKGELPNGRQRSLPIGDHAVTIVGYHIGASSLIEFDDNIDLIPSTIDKKDRKPMYMRSSKIDKLYVHDDQLGPFASMGFRQEDWQHLTTGWYRHRVPSDQVNATVSTMIFPLYHKIRIRFNTIFSIIRDFNTYYMEMWKNDKVVWDIYLTTVCDLKKRILSLESALLKDTECRLKMLKSKLPRYIWVADAYVKEGDKEEKLSFSFYFDATDIDNSDLFICALHYDLGSYTNICLQAGLNFPESSLVLSPDSKFNYQSWRILNAYVDPTEKKIIKPSDSYQTIEELKARMKDIEKQIGA